MTTDRVPDGRKNRKDSRPISPRERRKLAKARVAELKAELALLEARAAVDRVSRELVDDDVLRNDIAATLRMTSPAITARLKVDRDFGIARAKMAIDEANGVVEDAKVKR